MGRRLVVLVLAATALRTFADPDPAWGKIELVRDGRGVPHVFADTDLGAMYGLGRACAEDRAFQMTLSLRIIQGRLAEVLGDVPHPSRKGLTTVGSDRAMRAVGWHRAAVARAAGLDEATLALLRAYCAGIDDHVARHRTSLSPAFARHGVAPEPWTPADCIATWWNLARYFSPDGTRDLLVWKQGRAGNLGFAPPVPPTDDAVAAVIRRTDVSDEWLELCRCFCELHGLPRGDGAPAEDLPKYSHAWVVGKGASTTGAATLVSDPQTPVRNPSLWYEYHVAGHTIDARGIGVPGCPALLLGWTPGVAWGLTALGADQADLFRLDTARDRPDQYCVDSVWRPMRVRTERIAVKGGADVELVVRDTDWGPVVTEHAFARPGDPEVALKRVPLVDTGKLTLRASFAMMRARDADGLERALEEWIFPTANIVYGDARGRIGYRALGLIPVRPGAREEGREALDGGRAAHDWAGYVPFRLMPNVRDPARGYLESANHRPIGAFYPIPIGISTGSGGDTDRSWRLRELLSARAHHTPADVLAMHRDAVHPARRDIAFLGLVLRDAGHGLSGDARRALVHLEPWLHAGASSELTSAGAALAQHLDLSFRMLSNEMALVYGGGQSGLARWLRHAVARATAGEALGDREVGQLDHMLAAAHGACVGAHGDDPGRWATSAVARVAARRIAYLEGLDGWGSFDRALDLAHPPLACADGGTIRSQAAQSYTQFVPLHDVDAAQSLLPIGHSEHPEHARRLVNVEPWATGELLPAPISRARVEQLAVSRERLDLGR